MKEKAVLKINNKRYLPMPDFTHRFTLLGKTDSKTPNPLSVYIIIQYANSLRVEKKLPIHLNSFIIN